MAILVAILEDNADRIAEMRACLSDALPGVRSIFFENAFEMIGWLEQSLAEVALISLDHDLPLLDGQGKPMNCGHGRMVVDFLASLSPTCPVIVHSSNNYCAPGMFFALKEAGWRVARIVPYGDQTWVRGAWMEHVLQLVRDG